jgi:hypothetical protein
MPDQHSMHGKGSFMLTPENGRLSGVRNWLPSLNTALGRHG